MWGLTVNEDPTAGGRESAEPKAGGSYATVDISLMVKGDGISMEGRRWGVPSLRHLRG